MYFFLLLNKQQEKTQKQNKSDIIILIATIALVEWFQSYDNIAYSAIFQGTGTAVRRCLQQRFSKYLDAVKIEGLLV